MFKHFMWVFSIALVMQLVIRFLVGSLTKTSKSIAYHLNMAPKMRNRIIELEEEIEDEDALQSEIADLYKKYEFNVLGSIISMVLLSFLSVLIYMFISYNLSEKAYFLHSQFYVKFFVVTIVFSSLLETILGKVDRRDYLLSLKSLISFTIFLTLKVYLVFKFQNEAFYFFIVTRSVSFSIRYIVRIIKRSKKKKEKFEEIPEVRL